MRRIYLTVFLVLLILCGCGAQDEGTEPTTSTFADDSGVCYMDRSAVELETGGAVRTYSFTSGYNRIYSMGSKILLTAPSGEMIALNGKDGTLYAKTVLDRDPGEVGLAVSQEGVGYYLSGENRFVLLNPQLQETDTFPMPQDMVGMPHICLERNEIFYCTKNEIRAINIQTEISRPVRKHTCKDQKLMGCYFDGKVLLCQFTDLADETVVLYLSGEDGTELLRTSDVCVLQTDGARYYAQYMDGIVPQRVVGQRDGASMNLLLDGECYLVPGGSIVDFSCQHRVLQMNLLDLSSGVRKSYQEIRDILPPASVAAGEYGVWFLAADSYRPDLKLYHWDTSASAVEETESYIQPIAEPEEIHKTPEIKRCFDRAEEIFYHYGVRVAITDQAVKMAGEHDIQPEYLAQAYEIIMDRMEAVFSQYPNQFLTKKYDVRVGIVRSINGKQDPLYIRSTDIHSLIIPVGCDVETALYRMTGCVIDVYLRDEKMQYLKWDSLNPEGFTYGTDSIDQSYLSGDHRAFLNEISMVSPTDDRAELFAAAMTDGNGELFDYPILQQKLRAVCEAIRGGFWYQDDAMDLPWEQYLKDIAE